MKNALVVIDVQNYFVNEQTKDLPDKIAKFIKDNKFDFVLFSRFVNNKSSNFVKLLNWRKSFLPPDTDIHSALREFSNSSNTFKKSAYSVFKSPGFVDFLNKNNISKLSLCGIDTDSCVLASAYDAFDLGYEVKVLVNLSKSHSGEDFDNAAIKIINKSIRK